jgi:aspartyl-tRNA(Asn)/glutamyl-tRNA(Gln) amidotransferase subunit A
MPDVGELHFLTIARAAELIKARQLSPLELARAWLDRIDALDDQINAFITVTAERALEQACKAEAEIGRGHYRGPLHGIPFGLKDLYATAGVLTTGHSRVRMSHVPSFDAAAVERMYAAGAILLGKLATTEFAHSAPTFDAPWPPARNPWNPAHFTGSSSSGAGAAVAAGFLPVALGTDTGASVRNPASMCGTVGLKPTFGLVSRYGVTPNSYSFDHCGPLTWTVEDCAIVLGALAGHDRRDPVSVERPVPDYRAALRRDLDGIRVGIVRHFWEEDLATAPALSIAMNDALDVLAGLGARVEDVRMRPLQDYMDVKTVIAETEVFGVHQNDLAERASEFGLNFLSQTLSGCLFTADEYFAAQRERRRMQLEMQPLYRDFDVLVTASAGPAPRFDAYSPRSPWQRANLFTAFSVTAGPALALCIGYTADGLPLSMQIAGAPFTEEQVLHVGYAYEQATPWRERRPRIEPGTPRVPVTPPSPFMGTAIDPALRVTVDALARRARLALTEEQLTLLCEVAPFAFERAARVRRGHGWTDDPAFIVRVFES